MAKIDELLEYVVDKDASDLHFCAQCQPYLRLWGDIVPIDGHDPIPADEARDMLFEILNEEQKAQFSVRRELDLAYTLEGVARFRVNIHMETRGMSGAFRVIPSKLMTVEELGLPEAVKELSRLHQGLVLVTGPSGCGKSTTVASLIDLINREQGMHIITIEDPVEFIHENKRSYIDQREVGVHTKSYATALRAALREDPDVIMVGEMRDLESIALTISAAETGHLVFSTLHTRSAAKTVDRIINVFPGDQQSQIRTQLSGSLSGVVSQVLLKNSTGTGRIMALEILIRTTALSSLVRDGATYKIPSIMQTGKKMGMIILDDYIMGLLEQGLADPRHAMSKALDPEAMRKYLASGDSKRSSRLASRRARSAAGPG